MQRSKHDETVSLRTESTTVPEYIDGDRPASPVRRISQSDRSFAIEVAHEEYCRLRDDGEEVNAKEFCRGYPEIYASLVRQIEVEEFMRRSPSIAVSAFSIEWPKPGDELFRLTVVEEIGRGAFARVYLCLQNEIGGRHVVLKVAYGGAYEANTMGKLTHPNVMQIHSVQQDEKRGLSAICMPFVGRSTLFDVMDHQTDEPPKTWEAILDAANRWKEETDQYHQLSATSSMNSTDDYLIGVVMLGRQMAGALVQAHGRGIVHGDLKPSNVVLSTDAMAVIVDFNLSKDPDAQRVLTGGTLPYMPPEQMRALREKDKKFEIAESCDVYSLAAMLYELSHGSLPFGTPESKGTPDENLRHYLDVHERIAKEQQPALATHSQFDRLLWRCLDINPASRPSMAEVETELRLVESELRAAKKSVFERIAAPFMVLSLCLTIGVVIWISNNRSDNDPVDVPQPPMVSFAELVRRDELELALEQATNEAVLNPNSAESHYSRGQISAVLFHRTGNESYLESAELSLDQVPAEFVKPHIAGWRAYLKLASREFVAADKAYDRIIKEQGPTVVAWNNRALAKIRLAGRAKLLVRYARAVGNETDAEAFATEGTNHLRKAIEYLEEAVAIDSQVWQPHQNLTKCYETIDSLTDEERLIYFFHAEQAAQLSKYAESPCMGAIRAANTLFFVTGDARYADSAVDYLAQGIKHGMRIDRDRFASDLKPLMNYAPLLNDLSEAPVASQTREVGDRREEQSPIAMLPEFDFN